MHCHFDKFAVVCCQPKSSIFTQKYFFSTYTEGFLRKLRTIFNLEKLKSMLRRNIFRRKTVSIFQKTSSKKMEGDIYTDGGVSFRFFSPLSIKMKKVFQ